MSRTTAPKRDIYQETTDAILSALEKGVAPWTCPWTRDAPGPPRNGLTGRAYNGTNVIILWTAQMLKGYASNQWYTFRQANEAVGLKQDAKGRFIPEKGKGVRKGEKSTPIVYWDRRPIRGAAEGERGGRDAVDAILDGLSGSDADESSGRGRSYLVMKHFNVFNRDQIDGLPPLPAPAPRTEWERIEAAEAFLAGTGAVIHHGGNHAFYRGLPTDEITMPDRDRFPHAEEYYSTAFHELAHWTGAKHRLDRPLGNAFGTPAYAEEELVAELSAAFLSADHEFSGQLRHPEYIGSWIKRLKDDNKAIFRAASAARVAAEYLHGCVQRSSDATAEPSALAA